VKKVVELTQAKAADYLTAEEAAILLDMKEATIRNYLTDGRLTTYRFKTATLIKRTELETKFK